MGLMRLKLDSAQLTVLLDVGRGVLGVVARLIETHRKKQA